MALHDLVGKEKADFLRNELKGIGLKVMAQTIDGVTRHHLVPNHWYLTGRFYIGPEPAGVVMYPQNESGGANLKLCAELQYASVLKTVLERYDAHFSHSGDKRSKLMLRGGLTWRSSA